jgi:hypothetical protein
MTNPSTPCPARGHRHDPETTDCGWPHEPPRPREAHHDYARRIVPTINEIVGTE